MAPGQPPGKRKADDTNPLNNAMKRPKKDNGASNKRKLLNGEEQPGGLVIVRAQPSRPPSAQATKAPSASQPLPPPDRTSSHTPPLPHSQPFPARHAPTAKRFKAAPEPGPSRKGKERDVPGTARPEQDVDEDVRQMETETDDLRRQSQSQSRAHPSMPMNGLHLPPPSTSKPRSKSKQPQHEDTLLPLAPRETPQIEKNKAMRGEASQAPSGSGTGPASASGHRRRSSLSMRGKRTSTSFATQGIITTPHSSVGDSSFFKHIDAEQPEALRQRQLLIWCASRSISERYPDPTSTPSKRHTLKDNGKDPPLSEEGKQLLREAMDDVVRMLADRQIDVSGMSPSTPEGEIPPKLKENEQNVKNRAREVKFSADIARANAEEEAWREVTEFYNAHQAAVVADIERSRQARSGSSKAKGKQRADPLDDFEPRDAELPDVFRGEDGVQLARRVLAEGANEESALSRRINGLPYTIDHLHSLTHTSAQITSIAGLDLDQRFALLSLTLHARTQAPAAPAPAPPSALSAYLPLRAPTAPAADPIDLFRALSRIDMARPPGEVSDAARRAQREVARGGGALAERRLTAGVVPPPTPRKPPGTPRRTR